MFTSLSLSLLLNYHSIKHSRSKRQDKKQTWELSKILLCSILILQTCKLPKMHVRPSFLLLTQKNTSFRHVMSTNFTLYIAFLFVPYGNQYLVCIEFWSIRASWPLLHTVPPRNILTIYVKALYFMKCHVLLLTCSVRGVTVT